MKILIGTFLICCLTATSWADLGDPVLNEIEKRYNDATKNVVLTTTLTAGSKYSCTQFYKNYGELKTQVLNDVFIFFNNDNLQNFGSVNIRKFSSSNVLTYYVSYPFDSYSSRAWNIAKTQDDKLIIWENSGVFDSYDQFQSSGFNSFLVCNLNEGEPAVISKLINSYRQAHIPETSDLKMDKDWVCKGTLTTPEHVDQALSAGNFQLQLVPYSEGGITVADLYLNKRYYQGNGYQFYKAIRDPQGKVTSFQNYDKNQTIRTDGTNLILENRIFVKSGGEISFGLPSVEDSKAISVSYGVCQ